MQHLDSTKSKDHINSDFDKAKQNNGNNNINISGNIESVIQNNIFKYKSQCDIFIDDIDASKYKPSLDEDNIKANYQKFLFDNLKEPINGNDFHNWFLLYSGENYNDIKDIIFTGNIPTELQRHMYLFLQSFIDYCNELSGEHLKKFLWCFEQTFFSFSPNIFNYLPSQYQFLIISQLLKNDDLSNIRGKFIGAFHYEFVFSRKESLNSLLKEIDKGGEVSAINSINMLSIVISNLGGYAEDNLVANVNYISEKIFEKYNNPFFKYKAQKLLEDIDYIVLNGFPPSYIDNLTKTNNVEFTGENDGYNVKVASDYVSSISSMGYSTALANYEWVEDEGNNGILNDTYEFYRFLETSHILGKNNQFNFNDHNAEQVYAYMDKLYYDKIDANDKYLKEMCVNILGDMYGNSLYDIFMGSIKERIKQNEIFNEFVEQARKDYENPFNSPEYNIMLDSLNSWLNNFLRNNIYPQIQLIFGSNQIIKQESNKVLVNGSSYNEILSSSEIDIYGNLNTEESSLFMQEMHTPEMIYMINKDLGIDITNLTLQSQLHLLRFLWEKTPDEFEAFKQVLKSIENKEAFMTTFLACSKNPEIGNTILELAEHKNAEQIFEAYSELVDLQTEIDSTDLNLKEFLKSILSRGEQLLQDANTQFLSGKNEIEIQEKYSTQLVKNIAFVKAIINNQKSGEVLSKEEFNEKAPGYKISSFRGDKNLLKNINITEMMDEENYTSPDTFSQEDFKMIFDNYTNTYYHIDKKWGEILQRNIANDITNPDVEFFMIRDENEKLIAVCKIKQKSNGDIYLGTHYVEGNYQKDSNLGKYILDYAVSQYKDAKNIIGDVAISNKSLERHINHGGFICNGIDTESDEKATSKEFFTVRFPKNIQLQSKNIKDFSNEKLKSLVQENISNSDIQVRLLDSSPGNEQHLIDTSKEYFSRGYVISRIFYEKDNGVADLKNMYTTFEKVNKDEEL